VCRHLGIKQPHLKGQDVKEVQRKLGLRGKDVDGFYGPATAGRVQEWKWRNGFPENRITTSLGLPGLALLFRRDGVTRGFPPARETTEGQALSADEGRQYAPAPASGAPFLRVRVRGAARGAE
jgi:peptidoglycan hydrolase-like protein with peptidoglycan-binding domain